MSMRTPLGRVRGLGSAKEGTEHFWRQRVTAVANIPLVLFMLGLVVTLIGEPHAVVAATLGQPFIAIVTLLALISFAAHMRLGMQIIIEDYVHDELLKVLSLMANTFFCAFIALGGTFAVLKLSLGG